MSADFGTSEELMTLAGMTMPTLGGAVDPPVWASFGVLRPAIRTRHLTVLSCRLPDRCEDKYDRDPGGIKRHDL